MSKQTYAFVKAGSGKVIEMLSLHCGILVGNQNGEELLMYYFVIDTFQTKYLQNILLCH